MLISFSVSGFRSFGKEQTLSMLASGKFQNRIHESTPLPGTDHGLLRTSIIFGANASGKSNLIKAMAFAKDKIKGDDETHVDQFRFQEEESVSSFEFRFLSNDEIYTYGFDILGKDIKEEWLSVRENDLERELYSRSIDGKIQYPEKNKSAINQKDEPIDELLKALELLGVRENQLFLSRIVELNQVVVGQHFRNVVSWFTKSLNIITPGHFDRSLIDKVEKDSDFKLFVCSLLDRVGTGIAGLEVEKSELEIGELPDGFPQDRIIHSDGSYIERKKGDSTKIIRGHLITNHSVNEINYELPFREESDGTRQFLHLIPALYALNNDENVFVIDELDLRLHPLLSIAYLKFFKESCPKQGRQLIFTTHEEYLLDQTIIDRDEVWFVEKNKKQESELSSLAEFTNIRSDLRLHRGYLQGRFGGIPYISDLEPLKDFLTSRQEQH